MKLPVYVFLSPYATVSIDNIENAKPHDLTIYTKDDFGVGYVLVGKTEIEFDLKGKEEIAAGVIQNLRLAKDLLIEEHEAQLRKINTQIANMAAITYEA